MVNPVVWALAGLGLAVICAAVVWLPYLFQM